MKRAAFLIKETMHRQIKSVFLLKFAGSHGKYSCWKLWAVSECIDQQQFESFCTLCKMPVHSLAQGTFCFQLPDSTEGPSWYRAHPDSGKLSF